MIHLSKTYKSDRVSMFIDSVKKNTTTSKSDLESETPLRSVIKSISWRILGTLDTIGISWLITKEISLAPSIGSVELLTKMILYFFHERIWNQIRWGK